jgi:hypothetical protein
MPMTAPTARGAGAVQPLAVAGSGIVTWHRIVARRALRRLYLALLCMA